jgi:hypothetical protein
MRLIKLFVGRHTVVAPAPAGASSEVQRFLLSASPDMQASARGMLALFQRYAQDGRARLTSSNFHEANREEGIWEFIKGRLRVFCFVDQDGALIVLSHGAVKKQQKADRREVERTIRLKQAYLQAKATGAIELADANEKGGT